MTGQVFLVTSGEYSDYRIVAAFATQELADAYAQHSPGSYGEGNADVEPWDLLTELPELLTWLELRTVVSCDGVAEPTAEATSQEWAIEKEGHPCRCFVYPREARNWSAGPIPAHVDVSTTGIDHDRVRKVHAEALARSIAMVDVLLAPGENEHDRVNSRAGHALTAELNA